MVKKSFIAFSSRANPSRADGSLGFKIGEMVKVMALIRDSKQIPLELDKHGHVFTQGGDRFYGSNTKQQKGWFSVKSVDISYSHDVEGTNVERTMLSQSQIDKLKKQFDALDKDGSGYLSVTELQVGLRKLGQDLTPKQAQELANMVKNDQSTPDVTFQEFTEMVRLRLESGKRKIHVKKRKAVIVIQRLVRRWLVHMTLPYPIPGPKLIEWAKQYKLGGEKAARPFLDATMEEQENIRAEQWEHLKAKNEERRARMAAKRQVLESKMHGDKSSQNQTGILKTIMVEIFTEVVEQLATNVVEEVTGKRVGQRKNRNAQKNAAMSKESIAALKSVIKSSKIITDVQKNGASGLMYHVKTKEQQAYLLMGVLKSSTPQALLKVLNIASSLPANAKVKTSDRKAYSDAVKQSRASKAQKNAADNAVKSIGTHKIMGDMLLGVLRGDSPYKINSFVKDAKGGASQSVPGRTVVASGRERCKGDKRASTEMTMEFQASVMNAGTWMTYQQQATLNSSKEDACTECQQAGVVTAVLLNQSASFIRRQASSKGTADDWGKNVVVDKWKTTDKEAILDLCKKCGLSTNRVISVTKAIKASTAKSEAFTILVELLGKLTQIKLKEKAENKSKKGKRGNGSPNSSQSNRRMSLSSGSIAESKRKIDQSPAAKKIDIGAAVGNIMFIDRLSPMQRRGAKLACQHAETLADIIIIYSHLMTLDGPDALENATSNYGTKPRTLEGLIALITEKLPQSFFNKSVQKGVTAALKVCKSHKALVAVVSAGIAGKRQSEILEAPSILSDAEKSAFITILNKCRECHTNPKMMDVAKKCAASITSFGEEATILTSVINREAPKILRKNANVSSVDGTRKRTEINDKERNRTIECLERTESLEDAQKDALMEGLGYATTHEQLCQLLGAAVLRAPAHLMGKMVRPWAPSSQPHRMIKAGNVEYIKLEDHQRKSALTIIDMSAALAPGDKKVAKEVLSAAKTHVHVAAIFIAIVSGRSTNKYRKALYDTSEHFKSDTVLQNERNIVLAAVKSSRYAPAKRKSATEAIKNTKKSTVVAAVLGSLIGNKSPFQILNSSILGIEKKLAVQKVKTDKEIEEEKKNRASKELEKKFSTIRESSVFSVPIKDAAMDTLSKCNLPNQRVEVLLRLIQRKNEEEIKDTLKMRGLNRSLTEKERALVSDRLEEAELGSDHMSAALNMVGNASTKAEVETILVKSIGWLNVVNGADVERFLEVIDESNLITIEKKTYARQWIKKTDTKNRLLTMLQALLRWQIRPLHWVGIAYEEVFQNKPMKVFSTDVIKATLAAIKECNSPSDAKTAAKNAVGSARHEADLIAILNHLLEGAPIESIKSMISKKQPKAAGNRKGMQNKYKRKEKKEEKKKKKKKKKKKRERKSSIDSSSSEKKKRERKSSIDSSSSEESEDDSSGAEEATVESASSNGGEDDDEDFFQSMTALNTDKSSSGRGSFQNLKTRAIQRVRTNKRIAPNMKEALIVISETINKKEELYEFNRISRLLSPRDRALDVASKKDEASMIFLNMCYAIIDADPGIEFTEEREEKKRNLSQSKTCLQAAMCLWEEEEKVITGPARFVFKHSVDNPDYDTSCVLSQNDKHEIISYIENDQDITIKAVKTAVRKGVLSHCRSRKHAIKLLSLYDDGGTARQISAECRRFAAQGNRPRAGSLKKKKENIDNEAIAVALATENKEAADAVLAVTDLLDLSDYQKATGARTIHNAANVTERGSILQAILASENPKVMRSAAQSQHRSVNVELLKKIIEESSLPEDAKSVGVSEASEMETQEDRCRVLITTFRAAKQIYDVDFAGKEAAFEDASTRLTSKERMSYIKVFSNMKSLTRKEKLAVKEALSKLSLYEQLADVLLGVIKKSSRKALLRAATMEADENGTIEVQHIAKIKHAVQQSHMMEILHADHQNDIEDDLQNAETYKDLSNALYKFILCHSMIVDEVHATVEHVIGDTGGNTSSKVYVGKRQDAELEEVVIEKLPLQKVSKAQHIRINAGIAHYPHANAPVRKLAAREAATVKTFAHLVQVCLLFLQKVNDGTESSISKFDTALKKSRNFHDEASDECTDTERLILREIVLTIPQLSNRDIAAAQARSLQSKQEMLDLIEVILKEPIFGTRKMKELSSYCGSKSAVYGAASKTEEVVEQKEDAWDNWGTHNITEFVDDSEDEIPPAPEVVIKKRSVQKPTGKKYGKSPLNKSRTYSESSSMSSHLQGIQASAASYGAVPTTPPQSTKKKGKKESGGGSDLKKALQVCNPSVGRRLYGMHKRNLVDIAELGESGILLQLAKLPDDQERRVLIEFEQMLHAVKNAKSKGSKIMAQCIQNERYGSRAKKLPGL